MPSATQMNAAIPRVISESVSCPSSDSPVETIPVAITSAPAAGWAQSRVRPSAPVRRRGLAANLPASTPGATGRLSMLPLCACWVWT